MARISQSWWNDRVVAFTFDESDVLAGIGRYSLADGQVVTLSRNVTKGGSGDVSFLRQLTGNIGRFDAGSVLSDP